MKQNKKLKVGVYGIAGCAGCLLSFLYEDVFKEINNALDIRAFPLIKEDKYKGEFDVVFIEGTVVFDEDIVALNELRKRAKVIVALGSCACLGGVPSIKNFKDEKKVMEFVYPKHNHLKSGKPTPINRHIKVDYYLPQCPPNKKEIVSFVKFLVGGKKFKNKKDPVCVECRKRGNVCLLEEGELCLGPVTQKGCGSLCPNNGVGCYGCRGPTKDANYKAFIEMLKQKGYSEKEVKDRMETFAGLDFAEEMGGESKWLEK